MTPIKKLIKGSFYISLANVLFSVCNFLFWIIFGKLLELKEIGYVTTAFSLSFILSSIANLGFNYAVLREIQIKKEVLTNSLVLAVLSLSIFSFILILFKNLFPDFISLLPLIFLLSLIFIFSTILSFALLGLEKYKEYFITRLIMFLKIPLGLILFPLKSFGILLSLVFTSMISFSVMLKYLNRYFSKTIDLEIIKDILKLGLSNYPMIFSSFFLLSLSTTLIAYFTKNPEIAGLFYFSLMFLLVLEILPNSFNLISIPLGVKDKEIVKESIRIGLGMSLPLILLAIVFGKKLLGLIKRDFIKAYPSFLLLSLALVSDIFIVNTVSKLNAEKRLKELTFLGLFRTLSLISLFLIFPKDIIHLSLAYVFSSFLTSFYALFISRLFLLYLKSLM